MTGVSVAGSQGSNHLYDRRVKAAERSGGTSSEAIYSAVEHVITKCGLTGRILDYGSGVGDFTRRLLQLGRFDRVSAMDIMSIPEELKDRVEWLQQDLNIPVSAHDEKFDIIVAVEVIEHLENPRFILREIFKMLRPGGTAIITTPNNESWRSLIALLMRGHYTAFGERSYPAHITALLRKDLTRIFTEAGFRDISFGFTNQGGVPGRPMITWQQVSLGMLGGLRFSDNLLCVARKIS